MKAIVCRKYGSPEGLRLEHVPEPRPAPGEVLVKVRCAAVNDFDLGLLQGRPLVVRAFNGWLRPRVRIIGCEAAGEVTAVGSGVHDLAPGDAVFGDLSEQGFGAFAEYLSVPETALRRKPPALTFAQAAALPHAGALAAQALFDHGSIEPGQHVLFNGAGGGVGTLGLQLAKQQDVTVTCVDSADKLDMLRGLGADHVIDYRAADFTRSGERYDLIVDTRTTRGPADYLRALAAGGVYTTVGGSLPQIARCLVRDRWRRPADGRRLRVVALQANKYLERLVALCEAGKLAPVLDRTYPLAEVPAALHHFAEARHQGKVIVAVA